MFYAVLRVENELFHMQNVSAFIIFERPVAFEKPGRHYRA